MRTEPSPYVCEAGHHLVRYFENPHGAVHSLLCPSCDADLVAKLAPTTVGVRASDHPCVKGDPTVTCICDACVADAAATLERNTARKGWPVD